MAETYVPLQPWLCDKCGKGGDVEMPEHTDVWDGYQRILRAHREASPVCHRTHGVKFVRVRGGAHADPS
jgi:hypothetical protein